MSCQPTDRQKKKAAYMKIYLVRVKANGGKKLGSKYGTHIKPITKEEFYRRFIVIKNG
jgi:hypothetical protein